MKYNPEEVNTTTLDIETTFALDDENKTLTSPFFGQQIVSVGYRLVGPYIYSEDYLFFYHTKREPTVEAFKRLQQTLDLTNVLVGHNIKFDLQFLRECGFVYNGALYDTMVAEYLSLRGLKQPLGLDACCTRRGISGKLTSEINRYIKDGMSYEDMPPDVVEKYGRNDVTITEQLAVAQLKEFNITWFDVQNGE